MKVWSFDTLKCRSIHFLPLYHGPVAVTAGYSRVLPNTNLFLLLLGDPKVFPGQMRYIMPPAISGPTPPKARRHPNPPPFDSEEQRLYNKNLYERQSDKDGNTNINNIKMLKKKILI